MREAPYLNFAVQMGIAQCSLGGLPTLPRWCVLKLGQMYLIVGPSYGMLEILGRPKFSGQWWRFNCLSI